MWCKNFVENLTSLQGFQTPGIQRWIQPTEKTLRCGLSMLSHTQDSTVETNKHDIISEKCLLRKNKEVKDKQNFFRMRYFYLLNLSHDYACLILRSVIISQNTTLKCEKCAVHYKYTRYYITN